MLVGVKEHALITCLTYCVAKHRVHCNKTSDDVKEFNKCLKEKCSYCEYVADDVETVFIMIEEGD